MRKFSLLLFLLGASVCQAATYYVDFSAGLDTNNGTAKATPFKHAPGMTGCASTCGSTTLNGGDTVIFKGGVSWTASYPWTLTGGSAAAILYTTDHSWFNGTAYTQPSFDDGHADPGATGMLHLNNAGFVTLNDLYFLNCGTSHVANSDKCLVWENTHDVTITNSTFVTQSWIANYFVFDSSGSYSNFTITGNDFSATSGAIWFGSAQGSTSEHNVIYNHNTFHDFTAQLGGGVHGDGAWHYYGAPSSDSTQYVDGVTFCDNRFYGDFRVSFSGGGGMTAFFFTEGSFSGTICNNDMSYSPVQANMFDALIDLSGNSNSKPKTVSLYNNSYAAIGTNAMSAAYDFSGMVSGDVITSKNNIIYAPQYAIYLEDAPTAAAFVSDYNLLSSTSGQMDVAGVFKSYAQWQGLGYDVHGSLGTNPSWVSAPGNETLNATSPAIAAGVNLTSLGIPILNSDISGSARPSSAAWTMGVYNYGSSPYSIGNQQPVTTEFYPGSVFTTLLPAAASGECWNPAGGAPVPCTTSSADIAVINNIFASSDTAGGISIQQTTSNITNSQGNAFYYGWQTDPVFRVNAGSSPCPTGSTAPNATAANCPAGKYFHMPAGAQWDACANDEGLIVWDQSTDIDSTPGGRIVSSYFFGHGSCPSSPPTLPPTCTATTPAQADAQTACQQAWSTESLNFPFVDSTAWGNGISSMGAAGAVGLVREQELMQNTINHALMLETFCERSTAGNGTADAPVFPATSSAQGCSFVDSLRPLSGALFWIDSTYNCGALTAWQQPVCVAMQKYGGYLHATGQSINTGLWVNPLEGGVAHTVAGVNDPYFNEPSPTGTTAWIIANAGGLGGCSGGFPRTCAGTNGIEVVEDSATTAEKVILTIFNMPGLITGHHLHILDPCVPKGVAAQPGGCVTAAPTGGPSVFVIADQTLAPLVF